jgi:hypothetical protein
MTAPAIEAIAVACERLRQAGQVHAANELALETRPTLERLAASLAEIRTLVPAGDPARIEADAALKQYREGIA